jgi:creatinine amidohydrolase
MRISDMNWMQLEDYRKHDDRTVLPLGSTEQHAHLSVCTDSILSERVSLEAAEPLGVPVFPVLSYGISGYFSAYPGTVSLRIETYLKVIRDILNSLAGSGFRRILVVSGHGGNEPANNLAVEWMVDNPNMQVKFFQWWRGPKMMAKAQEIDPIGSHGSWFENFAWTRVPGIEMPAQQKILSDRKALPKLVGKKLRDFMGDGNYGGYYQRSDEDMQAIWQTAVEETREIIEKGWD